MSDRTRQINDALRSAGIATQANEPLSHHCTWRIGGLADLVVEPASVTEVQQVVRLSREAGLPW